MKIIKDRTNDLQIQYYQNHFNDYVNDALDHFNQEKKKLKDFNIDSIEPTSAYLATIVSPATNSSSLFISYQEFYIKQLDALDLFKEYQTWQFIKSSESKLVFLVYFA